MVGSFDLNLPPAWLMGCTLLAGYLAIGLFIAGLLACLAMNFTLVRNWAKHHRQLSLTGFYSSLTVLAINIGTFVFLEWQGWLNSGSDFLLAFFIFSCSILGAGEWALAAGLGRQQRQSENESNA